MNSKVGKDVSSFCLSNGSLKLKYFGNNELYSAKYLDWMNDTDIVTTIGRFEYLLPVTQIDLVNYVNNIDRTKSMFLAIFKNDDFIGTLKVYEINQLTKSAGIGIAIGDKNYWGKGVASDVISLVKKYLFDVLGLRRLYAGYYESNIGMEKAFFNNDFEVEGILREHIFTNGKFVNHKLVGCLNENRIN